MDGPIGAGLRAGGDGPLPFAKGGDGLWYSVDEPDFPLEQSCLTDLEETLSALKAVKVIRDPEEDASYGLDARAARRRGAVRRDYGVLLVGERRQRRLLRQAGGRRIRSTISSALMDGTDMGLMEMIALEEFPVVTEANAVSITLSLDGETRTLPRRPSPGAMQRRRLRLEPGRGRPCRRTTRRLPPR